MWRVYIGGRVSYWKLHLRAQLRSAHRQALVSGQDNFLPLVPELSKDDFILIGGRLEVIHQQPAAAIVYRRRQPIFNLYGWPSPGADSKTDEQRPPALVLPGTVGAGA